MRVLSDRNRGPGPRHQRGDILLEAMVGVMITALLGAAMAFVMSRVMNAQHTATVEQLVVENLRQELQVKGVGLCGHSPTISMPEALKSKAATAMGTATCLPQATNVVLADRTIAVTAPDEVKFEVQLERLGLSKTTDGGQPLEMSTKPQLAPKSNEDS